MNLSNNQLDSLLFSIVQRAQSVDLYSFILFETLYNTGLRINELIDYSRLSLIDVNTILVTTQKFSNPRPINTSYFNSVYLSNFLSNNLIRFIRSYSFYSTKFIEFNYEFSNLFVLSKAVTTHLFRHNYVKKLADSGFTVSEISALIGERSNTNTQRYIDSVIYSID